MFFIFLNNSGVHTEPAVSANSRDDIFSKIAESVPIIFVATVMISMNIVGVPYRTVHLETVITTLSESIRRLFDLNPEK
jgi:hypothetical protein